MVFRQITHDDLGCASYLIGDEHAGVAAVVDPKLEIEPYLALARYMGVRIEHVLETHNHPDLAVDKAEGAQGIYRSLHDKLLVLPDACEVWPGHLGGSLCGGPGMNMKVSSTIAYERDHNALLRLEDVDAFVRETTSKLGPQPPNFRSIVALNRGPLISEDVHADALTP